MKWYDPYGRLLMIIAIIAAVVVFAGCVEERTSHTPVPTSSPLPKTTPAPEPTSTTAPAETPEPTETSPTVYISGPHLADEWVKITNSGTSAVTMTGWKIADDDAKHTYIFPPFTLSSGAALTLHTGGGTDTNTELYWGGRYVWNNDGDTARLYDAGGGLIDTLKK